MNIVETLTDHQEQKKELSPFSDPFNKEDVQEIYFFIKKDMWDKGKIKFSSTVKFQSKSTEGTQRLTAESFASLVAITEEFIKTL